MKNKSANVILRVAHVDAHFIFLIGYCMHAFTERSNKCGLMLYYVCMSNFQLPLWICLRASLLHFCIAHRKVNGKYFVNEWAFMFNENDDDDNDDSNSENGW